MMEHEHQDDEEHLLICRGGEDDDDDDESFESERTKDLFSDLQDGQSGERLEPRIMDSQRSENNENMDADLYADSSSLDDNSSGSDADSSSMTTSSSSHSSKSWEILDGPYPEIVGEVDQAALQAAQEENGSGLVESVSRDAKQMFDGLKTEMKDISDGYSMIASGVDKVTTGIAEKINKAITEGAKSAENAVTNLKKDWFEDKEKNGNKSKCLDSEGNRKEKLTRESSSGIGKGATKSRSRPTMLSPSTEDDLRIDNVNKENQILRKITSVIHNNSSLLPINLRALHTEGLFSPTNEYPTSSQVSTEISYCGPGEQMIIETQQNDPFDPIAVLVVYEIVNVKSKESVGYLRLQAVWHCFEPVPRVGVSLGTEPAPSAESDAVTQLEVAEGIKIRCIAKQLDAVDGDYFVQSITVTSEEIGSIAMVGRSFEKLIQKFKAF